MAPSPLRTWLELAGMALFVASLYAAIRVHSLFPKRHDKPEDFDKLLTEGPYSYCRHPFYLSLIVNQFSIPIILSSRSSLVAFCFSLAGWWVLVKLEEAELIQRWGIGTSST